MIIAMGQITVQGIVQLILLLIVAGVALKFTQQYINETIFKIIVFIIVGAFVLGLLQFAGLI